MKKICVIGAGAAGCMAAYAAAVAGAEVHIFEKNEKIGKKLYITGKGRCNITNTAQPEEFLNNIMRNPKFMYSALNKFSNFDTIELFNELGLKTKEERGGRVFPESDKSNDVNKYLERELRRNGVALYLHSEVSRVLCENNKFNSIEADGVTHYFDACIIATGGISYQSTGSTGDGYKFAADNKINVLPQYPSLIPLTSNDEALKDLSGVSLKNVMFSLHEEKKLIYSEQGEMLFCHFGLSGPIVLSASAYINFEKNLKLTAQIDLKPALSLEKLDLRILRDFEKNKNKEIKNSLNELTISALIPLILSRSGINPEKKVNEITLAERKSLGNTVKNLSFKIAGTRPINEAIITRGGVDIREINAKTMEAKKISGLYFAGEVLDLDAKTGGYNLQIAWSTGFCAGSCAAALSI